MKIGFHKFCHAIEILHSDVKQISPKLELLQQLRDKCNTHRTLYGQRTVGDLFCLSLKATLHSQLDTVPADWQHLIKQFYDQSFCSYYKDTWQVDTSASVQSADDSGEWSSADVVCKEAIYTESFTNSLGFILISYIWYYLIFVCTMMC